MASRPRFWILSVLWVLVVFAATPFVFELFDRQGIGLLIPGLSVTASEAVLAAPVALGPPLLVLGLCRRSRRHLSRAVNR